MFCRRLTAFLLLVCGCNALTCYDCQIGTAMCTTTCTGALTCIYQVNTALMASNQYVARCEYTSNSTGCTGSSSTNILVCSCAHDLCNKLVNSTLLPHVAPPVVASTPGMLPAGVAPMPGTNLALTNNPAMSGVQSGVVPGVQTGVLPTVAPMGAPAGFSLNGGVPGYNAVPGAMPVAGQPTVPAVQGQGIYQQAVGPNQAVNPNQAIGVNQGLVLVPNTGTHYGKVVSCDQTHCLESYPLDQGVPQMGIAPMAMLTTHNPILGRRRRNVNALLKKLSKDEKANNTTNPSKNEKMDNTTDSSKSEKVANTTNPSKNEKVDNTTEKASKSSTTNKAVTIKLPIISGEV